MHQQQDRVKRLMRWYAVAAARALHRTLLSALADDSLNLAQSTAYSAIVALFPALIVAVAVIGLLPDTAPRALPDGRLLRPGAAGQRKYAAGCSVRERPKHAHSVRALVGAGVVSFAGASNVISTLMEGLRRARGLPRDCWSFWQRRRRSFELVPMSLVPLTIASLLVVFGHSLSLWLMSNIGPQLSREPIYAATLLLRWTVAAGRKHWADRADLSPGRAGRVRKTGNPGFRPSSANPRLLLLPLPFGGVNPARGPCCLPFFGSQPR